MSKNSFINIQGWFLNYLFLPTPIWIFKFKKRKLAAKFLLKNWLFNISINKQMEWENFSTIWPMVLLSQRYISYSLSRNISPWIQIYILLAIKISEWCKHLQERCNRHNIIRYFCIHAHIFSTFFHPTDFPGINWLVFFNFQLFSIT